MKDRVVPGVAAPREAQSVQYVKICSLYGVGFYYIPGTDMCLKVGGWARFETGYGYNGSFTTEWWNNDLRNRSTNENGDNPTTGNYFNRWFIQWAGFTFGHSTSFFDFYSIGANQYGFVSGGSDTGDGGWTVLGYTAQFGNGLSASISAEQQRRTRIYNDNFALGFISGLAPAAATGDNKSSTTRATTIRTWSPICASTRPGARRRSWARCTTWRRSTMTRRKVPAIRTTSSDLRSAPASSSTRR